MRTKFLSIMILLVISITNVVAANLLINKNGSFVPFDETTDVVAGFTPSEKCPKGSIKYYYSCLGYGSSEVITYFNDAYDVFALNAFNNEVIFIMPSDNTKTSLTQQEVNACLAGYRPSISDFASNLKSGVEDGSIKQAFVEKSLGLTAVNNSLIDEKHGFTYTFNNGILVSYKSNDGLSDNATYVKENFPAIFDKISTNAQINYGISKSAVQEYINGQCKYFLMINVNYLSRAYNSTINYNFALLYCILYEGMGLDEFSLLVPDSNISANYDNIVVMTCGAYHFTFKDKVHIKD